MKAYFVIGFNQGGDRTWVNSIHFDKAPAEKKLPELRSARKSSDEDYRLEEREWDPMGNLKERLAYWEERKEEARQKFEEHMSVVQSRHAAMPPYMADLASHYTTFLAEVKGISEGCFVTPLGAIMKPE